MRPASPAARAGRRGGPSRYATATWQGQGAGGATCGLWCTGATPLRALAGTARPRRPTGRRPGRTRRVYSPLSAWETSSRSWGDTTRPSGRTKRPTPSTRATRQCAPAWGGHSPRVTAATGFPSCSTAGLRCASTRRVHRFEQSTPPRLRWRAATRRRPGSTGVRSRRIPTMRARAWDSETCCLRSAGTRRPPECTRPESKGATSWRSRRTARGVQAGASL